MQPRHKPLDLHCVYWWPHLGEVFRLLQVARLDARAFCHLTQFSDGRRPIYLISLTIQCVGSFGVASAQNVPQLLSWRVIQALGSSSGHSVGMGVISDIYRLEERGTASGIYFAVRVHRVASLTLCDVRV